MKKINLIRFLCILIIGVIIGAVSLKAYDYISGKKEQVELTNQYEEAVENFIKITDIDFLNDQLKLSGFIYVGRKTCENCRTFAPVIKDIALEKNILINYFDTDEYRDSKKFEKILKKYHIESVPDFILIHNDGTYEKFNEENIKKGQIFTDWLVNKKEDKK